MWITLMHSNRTNCTRKHTGFFSSFLAPNKQWNPPYWWVFSPLNPHTTIVQYLVFYQQLPQIFLKRCSIKTLIHRNPLTSVNAKSSTDLFGIRRPTTIGLESSPHISKSNLLLKSPILYRSVSPSYPKSLLTVLASVTVKLL